MPIDKGVRENLSNLRSRDDAVRFSALKAVLKATDVKVDWAYDAWDGLVESLASENSYQRSIAAMLLCNLAKSDVEGRLAESIDALLALTRDEKFVTSRQCIQSLWKVAAGSAALKKKVVDHLVKRFKGCTRDKHYNLIRLDILQSLKMISDLGKDTALRDKAMALIQLEEEPRYRKKYEAAWHE